MKFYGFSFKNEAMWLMLFTFVPALIGILIILIVWLVRR